MLSVRIKLTESSNLVTRYTADFVGRKWLLQQVDALLEDAACRSVVLTGVPGVGKTAFMPPWLPLTFNGPTTSSIATMETEP